MEIRLSFSEKQHYAEGKFPLAIGILFLEGKFWEIFIWIAKGATKTFYTLSKKSEATQMALKGKDLDVFEEM